MTGWGSRFEADGPTSPEGVEVVDADLAIEADAKRACEGQRSSTTVPTRRAQSGQIASAAHGRRHRNGGSGWGRLVFGDNLYAYGPVDGPLAEDLRNLATHPNGRVRASGPPSTPGRDPRITRSRITWPPHVGPSQALKPEDDYFPDMVTTCDQER